MTRIAYGYGVRALCLILALTFPLALASPAFAQDRTLESIEAERLAAQAEQDRIANERQDVEAAIADIKTEMLRVSTDTDTLEVQATRLSERVSELSQSASVLEASILSDRRAMGKLVAALQRIEANPPPAIAGGAGSAIDAARAARLTSTVAGQLKTRSDALAEDLRELETVRIELESEREALTQRRDTLAERRAELRRLSQEKAELSRKLGEEQARKAARVEALVAEADTLRELISKLEAAANAQPRVKPPSGIRGLSRVDVIPRVKPAIGGVAPRPLPEGLRFADARGQLGLPVRGRISSGFGGGEKGVSVVTTNGAQVVSPYGGRIEFAGPFKNYERLVILNAGDGYFVVLTGLGETFVSSGESVGTGEPLGQMPRGATDPTLYIEFRKDGRTIDPTPWLDSATG